MSDVIPLKAVFTGPNATALAEFATGDTVPVNQGGTGSTTASGALSSLGAAPQTSLDSRTGTSGALSFRNRLINGNHAINQRGVSGTVTLSAGQYGHDRWKGGASGCTYTFSTSGADTTITISAGSLMQVVKGVNIEGGVYTLSNAGSANARIAINGASTSGSYAACPQQTSSATGGQNVTVEFTTGTILRAQLEVGTVATTFERLQDFDLPRCQRYYWKSFPQGTAPAQNAGVSGSLTIGTNATSTFSGSFQFPVVMQAAPSTVTTYNPSAANANFRDSNNGADRTLNSAVATDAQIQFVGLAGIVNGINRIHVTCEAEL
jgi:hypothetical protein